MEKNVVITISRQFGSNGREIARKLAEYLDISYYNKEILERIAMNMGVCADFFKDQKQDANGLFTIESRGLLGLRNVQKLQTRHHENHNSSTRNQGNQQPDSLMPH